MYAIRSYYELSVRFSENVLAETNAYTLHLQDENDLKGLPRSAVDQAREEAEQSGKTGWLFTLQQPSFMPFLKYADNRELRRQMAVASGTRGLHGNENDNREIIRQTVITSYSIHYTKLYELTILSRVGTCNSMLTFSRELMQRRS